MYKFIKLVYEVLTLREIRNTCCCFMTHNRNKIGVFDQFVWYYKTYLPEARRGVMKAIIFYTGEPIGYGLIVEDKNKQWLTGGLLPQYRSKGYGKWLFKSLIAQCTKTPYLEVLRWNTRAIKLYEKLGFKTVRKNKRIFVMKYEKK